MTLNVQTRFCKICFKEIKIKTFRSILVKNEYLCENCAKSFESKWISFSKDGVKCVAIYHYDENIRKLLFQLKGCFDYELYPVFLSGYELYLKARYKNYAVVPIPSYKEDDERRGFNHVEEIFHFFKCQMEKVLIKTEHHKQADMSLEERKQIYKYLKVKNAANITNRNVVLIDDVYTTGSTMGAAINLIRGFNPRKIEILVLSKGLIKDM